MIAMNKKFDCVNKSPFQSPKSNVIRIMVTYHQLLC